MGVRQDGAHVGGPCTQTHERAEQSPGNRGTLDDVGLLTTLDAYHLAAASPAIDGGLEPLTFVPDPGGADFFGTELPPGVGDDIGAHEAR